MKIGDVIESAIWLNGEETIEQRRRYEAEVRGAMDYLCFKRGVIHGKVTFTELMPENARVPQVPTHISGQRVRLLLGESTVVDKAPAVQNGSFITNLEPNDLMRLRAIIRRSWQLSGEDYFIPDDECDMIIERLGPEAALDTLRQFH